jgi:hypothetical protein
MAGKSSIFRSWKTPHVIPAQAGIHAMQHMALPMDSRLRGNDMILETAVEKKMML